MISKALVKLKDTTETASLAGFSVSDFSGESTAKKEKFQNKIQHETLEIMSQNIDKIIAKELKNATTLQDEVEALLNPTRRKTAHFDEENSVKTDFEVDSVQKLSKKSSKLLKSRGLQDVTNKSGIAERKIKVYEKLNLIIDTSFPDLSIVNGNLKKLKAIRQKTHDQILKQPIQEFSDDLNTVEVIVKLLFASNSEAAISLEKLKTFVSKLSS
ncbi:MAG: hypothetical protein H0X29_07435 [Parachlamydiaceae bacterium]|nr:hypothetical protein [Parachlamydiaceae bacterium]